MHLVRGGAGESWVCSALVDGAWERWLGNVVEVLRGPITRVKNRLLRLVSWGVEFARDRGIPNFVGEPCHAVDLLGHEVWLSILHDST